MALCINLHKSYCIFSRYAFASTSTKLLRCLIHNDDGRNITVDDTDVLDDFTTQLVQKKSDKWEFARAKRKLAEQPAVVKDDEERCKINIRSCSIDHLNTLLKDAIEDSRLSHIHAIIDQCIEYKVAPSLLNLLQILSISSQSGDKYMISKIKELCETVQPDILIENSDFKHYMAEAMWIKGNINEAINLFESVYRHNTYLRRRIRLMLKYLIVEVVSNRSEAALLNIVNFTERLVNDFRDFYPMACVWQSCFLSEWFSDQNIALDLLLKNEGLRKSIIDRVPYVVNVSLRNHQTDPVYRLLEISLKLDMKPQCLTILVALFDYRVREGDLRSCSEIIQWSLKHDILLPSLQQEEFLKLLLKIKFKAEPPSQVQIKSQKYQGYHMKF